MWHYLIDHVCSYRNAALERATVLERSLGNLTERKGKKVKFPHYFNDAWHLA